MSLKEKIKDLPRTPGVYIFKNKRGKPIYVGKALRLRNRVSSYFQKPFALENMIKASMLLEIVDVEIRQTDSEIEALVLEAYLIKKLQPRFNVAMKDDKQYFYVGFTKEPFPKVIMTHQLKTPAQGGPALGGKNLKLKTLIGPFVSGRSLSSTLRALRRIFPYCTCKRRHMTKHTCLNYHIGIDPGCCCSKEPFTRIQRSQYVSNLLHIKHILQGKKERVLKTLEVDMREAAAKKQFERAAMLRNQLEHIDYILAHKRIVRGDTRIVFNKANPSALLEDVNRIEGYDISNIQGQFAVGSLVVVARDAQSNFVLQKSDYRRFKIKTVRQSNDPAMMHEVVKRRLRHPEWPLPDIMLIDGGVTQRGAALEAAGKMMPAGTFRIWSLAKQHEELYTDNGKILLNSLSGPEARVLKLVRDEAHRFAITYYRGLHRKVLSF